MVPILSADIVLKNVDAWAWKSFCALLEEDWEFGDLADPRGAGLLLLDVFFSVFPSGTVYAVGCTARSSSLEIFFGSTIEARGVVSGEWPTLDGLLLLNFDSIGVLGGVSTSPSFSS